jgi:hypothetical protein
LASAAWSARVGSRTLRTWAWVGIGAWRRRRRRRRRLRSVLLGKVVAYHVISARYISVRINARFETYLYNSSGKPQTTHILFLFPRNLLYYAIATRNKVNRNSERSS